MVSCIRKMLELVSVVSLSSTVILIKLGDEKLEFTKVSLDALRLAPRTVSSNVSINSSVPRSSVKLSRLGAFMSRVKPEALIAPPLPIASIGFEFKS